VLALITALVAPYFIDWDAYRADFEKEASRILGQQVTVSGKAKARLLPFPSVTFENVRVGDPEKPLVVADRFSMDAELAPFLSGELLIFDMRLVNPTIEMDIDERGMPDWVMSSTGPVSPARVVLENARITNGAITLHDRIDGRDWVMDGINATVSAESLLGPYRIDGNGWMTTTPLGFKISTGQLSKDGFTLRTVLEMERQGIELSVDGKLAKPEDEAGAPYNGTFIVRPLAGMSDRRYVVTGDFAASPRAVEVAEYRGEFGPAADPYVVSGSAGISGGETPRYRVEVTGTQVMLPEAAAGASPTPGAPAIPFAERLELVQSTLAALPFPPIPGSLDVDLPAVVAGDTTIRDIKLVASPDTSEDADPRRQWRLTDFEAQLPGRTTIEANGLLQLPQPGEAEPARFAGSLVVASRQPSGLATWLTGSADEAIRRLANAGVAADVLFSPERQTVDNLEVILGPARMRGHLERVSDPARRATLDIALSGEDLDFDALEALSAIFVGKDGAGRFADHDLDIQLDLSSPDIRGIPLDSLNASIRSRDFNTEIDRLSVTGLYGASVSATGSLDRRNDGLRAGIDATVVAGDGAELIAGLAERFSGIAVLDRFRAIAAKSPDAFGDTRLDIVGAMARRDALTGEASLSVSGATGGTELSVTATASGDIQDPERAAMMVNVALDNPQGEKIFAQAGLPVFPVASPGPLSAEATIDGSLFDGMRSALTLTGGDDMTAELDGVLTSDILSTGFTGKAQIEANDIEPWLLALGYAFPGTGLGTTADIRAAVSERGGKMVLRDIDAVLNANRITGELTVASPGAAPVVRGDLAFEYLDAGPLYAIISGDPAATVRVAEGDTALETDFGPPILADHDIEVAITAGELTFPTSGGALTDFKGNFVYRDSAMALNEMTARLGGSALGGLLSMRNDGGLMLMNAQLTADDVPVDKLVPAAGEVLSGRAHLALQLTGNGRSNKALIGSLTGSGVVSTGDLTVTGVRGDGFAELIGAADAIGYGMPEEQMREVAAASLLGGETVLPPKDYPVSVAKGEIRMANATARSGDLSIDLDAAMDLVTGGVTGNARLSIDPGEEEVAGPQPEIALSFKPAEDGGFDVTRDFGPVTGYLTQRLLEREQERVEALQARLLEKQRLRREVLLLQYYKRLDEAAPPEPDPAPGADPAEQEDALLQPLEPGETVPRADPAVMRGEAAAEVARRLATGTLGRDAAARGPNAKIIELNN
jgi:uncharacterized protein involved in outer membrane biogenesis